MALWRSTETQCPSLNDVTRSQTGSLEDPSSTNMYKPRGSLCLFTVFDLSFNE